MIKKYGRQLVIAAVAYSGYVVFGLAAGWSSPVLEKLQMDPDLFGDSFDRSQFSWIASSVYVGGIIGTIPLGYLANKIGRKWTLMIGAAVGPVSFICLALVKNTNVLIFIRVCLGVNIISVVVVNLVYLGEVSSTEIRGMILGTTGVFQGAGMLLVFIIGHYVSFQGMNYIAAGISLIYLVGIFFIPESPVHLLRMGQEKEATAVLIALNRKEDAERLSEMKAEIEATMNTAKWTQLFSEKCNRKALFITCSLFILQQLCGISPMLAYTTTIFEISGSSIPPHLGTILIGTVQLLSGLITSTLIERYGRRFLLLLSTVLTCLSLAVLSVYLSLDANGNPIVQKIKWLPLAMAILYFIAFGFGIGIIPSTLVGEMYQLNLRSMGTSVVILVNCSMGFVTVHSFGIIISGVGINVAFIIFTAVCVVTFLFTVFFVPETKGKSLLEVQKMLSL